MVVAVGEGEEDGGFADELRGGGQMECTSFSVIFLLFIYPSLHFIFRIHVVVLPV